MQFGPASSVLQHLHSRGPTGLDTKEAVEGRLQTRSQDLQIRDSNTPSIHHESFEKRKRKRINI
ncbi:hypothetical protein Hanom_Chr17g01524461 [Helianthus anomalus]